MSGFIPQIEPWIDHSELHQLKRVIDSTYVVENKLTEEFETLIPKGKSRNQNEKTLWNKDLNSSYRNPIENL